MFDLINRLPVHVLVVHAVVVLVPMSALGAIALAVRPGWRRTYGPLLSAIAVLAAILTPVASSSGEALEERVGDPGLHAELGGFLVYAVIPLALLVLGMTYLERRGSAEQSRGAIAKGVAALAVVVALVTTGLVVWIGDTGARAAWQDQVGQEPSSSAPAVGGHPGSSSS